MVAQSLETRILAVITNEPTTEADLIEATGIGRMLIRQVLKRMLEAGLIRETAIVNHLFRSCKGYASKREPVAYRPREDYTGERRPLRYQPRDYVGISCWRPAA